MHLAIIAAISKNRVIGVNNRLPWHLPADLRHFREITMGKPILMGRKTFDSIGRPLPGRTNVVITRDKGYQPRGCTVYKSLDTALDQLIDHEAVMVIGGAALYEACFPLAAYLYITLVHHVFEGDTYFPNIRSSDWTEMERQDLERDSKNPFDYSFIQYQKIPRTETDIQREPLLG